MRIAYITFERPGPESGVGNKLNLQTSCWRAEGHEVVNFVLNTPSERSLRDGVEYIYLNDSRKPLVNAALYSGDLSRRLQIFNPDLVYSRQLIWFPGLVKALRGFKLVQEINSDIEIELGLLSGVSGSLKRSLYSIGKEFVEPLVSGLVFVTHELAGRLLLDIKERVVISNGFVFPDKKPLVDKSQNDRPALIFVGSPGQNWHGIDKVVEMAVRLPEFDFHVVVPGMSGDAPSNLFWYGQVIGSDLENMYRRMDVAIGSLACHRKGLQEACPLKCREYSANGLPIVAGYHDTDLSGASYFLEMGNYEENVHDSISKIRDFVYAWKGRSYPYDDARARLDAVAKERMRLSFFQEIVR